MLSIKSHLLTKDVRDNLVAVSNQFRTINSFIDAVMGVTNYFMVIIGS